MRYLVAALAALVVVNGAAASKPATNGLVFTPGASPTLAMAEASFRAHAAQLRKDWLAAGNPDLPTSHPSILGGRILTPTINVERQLAAPAIQVGFESSSSGLESVSFLFRSTTTDQWIQSTYTVPSSHPAMTHGTLTIQAPNQSDWAGNPNPGVFGPFTAPGTWMLQQIDIADRDGGSGGVGCSFLSCAIHVINHISPDVTPPMVIAGRVLTPTVSLGRRTPSFGVEMTVADNLSGVANGILLISDPNNRGPAYFDLNATAAPVREGKVRLFQSVAGGPAGTWTIVGVVLYDAAGNVLDDHDVQSLFGTTTFTVTD
jgi:hypothetical protein